VIATLPRAFESKAESQLFVFGYAVSAPQQQPRKLCSSSDMSGSDGVPVLDRSRCKPQIVQHRTHSLEHCNQSLWCVKAPDSSDTLQRSAEPHQTPRLGGNAGRIAGLNYAHIRHAQQEQTEQAAAK
jgi:hypothetical protein